MTVSSRYPYADARKGAPPGVALPLDKTNLPSRLCQCIVCILDYKVVPIRVWATRKVNINLSGGINDGLGSSNSAVNNIIARDTVRGAYFPSHLNTRNPLLHTSAMVSGWPSDGGGIPGAVNSSGWTSTFWRGRSVVIAEDMAVFCRTILSKSFFSAACFSRFAFLFLFLALVAGFPAM
jgi:hypothetical protein